MNVHVVCSAGIRLSQDELKNAIPMEVRKAIKAKDPKPFYKAWVFVHEGVSRPYDYGQQAEYTVTWEGVRSAVKAAQSKLTGGLFFSDGHQITADPSIKDLDGRDPVGQVVSVFSRSVGAKEYGIVIGYFPPEQVQKAKAAKAVSVDAMWEAIEQPSLMDKVKRFFVKMFAAVDSIALLINEAPGFPEATELSEVKAQHVLAFDPVTIEQPNPTEQKTEQKERMSENPVEQAKRLIRENNIWLSQLYSPEDVFGKRKILQDGSTYFQGGDKIYNDWLIAHESEIQAKSKEERKELEGRAKRAEELEKKLKSIEAVPMLEERIREMNGPETMLKLAKRRMNGHDLSDEESINKFLKEIKEEHEDLIGPVAQPAPEKPAQDQPRPEQPEPNLGARGPVEEEIEGFGPKDDF